MSSSGPRSKLSKKERLDIFFQELQKLPAAHDNEEAYEQICQTLNLVEEQYSGVPYEPTQWERGDRMYPPQEDSRRKVEGRDDVVRFRSKGHNTYIRDNGAIEIAVDNPQHPHRQGKVLLSKPGADGKGIELHGQA